jgi:hypothetical protein
MRDRKSHEAGAFTGPPISKPTTDLMNIITRLGMFATAGAALALSSCATGGKSPSGILSNFAQLDAGYGTENAVSSYVKPGADLKQYDSVIIDPVTTVVASPGVSPAVTDQLAAYLSESLRSQMAGGLKIVAAPGPKTLRVRTGLTDVISAAQAGQGVTAVHAAPRATLSGNLGSAAVAGFVSNVAFEGEILDSVTGERLVALVDHRLGSKREATAQTSWAAVRSGVNQGVIRLRDRIKAAKAL